MAASSVRIGDVLMVDGNGVHITKVSINLNTGTVRFNHNLEFDMDSVVRIVR